MYTHCIQCHGVKWNANKSLYIYSSISPLIFSHGDMPKRVKLISLSWSPLVCFLQETATTILHSALVPIPLPVVLNAAKLDAQSHSGARKLDIALAAKLVSQLSISILLFVSVLRAFISFNSFHLMHAHSCMCAGWAQAGTIYSNWMEIKQLIMSRTRTVSMLCFSLCWILLNMISRFKHCYKVFLAGVTNCVCIEGQCS